MKRLNQYYKRMYLHLCRSSQKFEYPCLYHLRILRYSITQGANLERPADNIYDCTALYMMGYLTSGEFEHPRRILLMCSGSNVKVDNRTWGTLEDLEIGYGGSLNNHSTLCLLFNFGALSKGLEKKYRRDDLDENLCKILQKIYT